MARDPQNENRAIIEALYRELAKGSSKNVVKHLATDLEWWFHGPPHCQHMMRVLTGESAQPGFQFEPRSVTPIDSDRVIAEGWEGPHAYWVHVWTLKGGLITQLREYFNTQVTVRDLRPRDSSWEVRPRPTLWQSQQPSRIARWSMPDLLLAL